MSSQHTPYAVSGIVLEFKKLLELSYPDIWVEGEVQQITYARSGHVYFTLKDDTAVLRCAQFKNRRTLVSPEIHEGDLVVVRGKISVYAQRSDLQMIVSSVAPAGEGQFRRAFERLKKQLSAEGLFNQGRKQALPPLIKRLAVITSPKGSVVHDILQTLERRQPRLEVVIFPCQVQGQTAAAEICQQIANTENTEMPQFDAVIIARGGGSAEDLHAFNDERVVRAISNCAHPIVSGVGHETDVTLCDLAADLRAPTPTAAAEHCSTDSAQDQLALERTKMRLNELFERQLQAFWQQLDRVELVLNAPKLRIQQKRQQVQFLNAQSTLLTQTKQSSLHQRITLLSQRLQQYSPLALLSAQKTLLNNCQTVLNNALQQNLQSKNSSCHKLNAQLRILSPLNTLERGYSITQNAKGEVLTDPKQVLAGDTLTTKLATGDIISTAS